ncbi:amidohydrolase family protein [Chachezhania sediminis]|uniref:amidohydrolase family protein n=1 Tax=Chachezhania sediminis TaxID=2599291 RepID=UPI00131D3D47|nr:amidohydrolase family protein [Chachezhania sediminis]
MPQTRRYIDHHCHGIVDADLTRPQLEALMAEAHLPAPDGCTQFDKPLGLLVRRYCAPVLGLDPFASPEDYVARRTELGGREASRRLMQGAGMTELLIDTGHRSDTILDVPQMAEITGCATQEVIRIEAVMEAAAKQAGSAEELVSLFAEMMEAFARDAVALKSIVAYRVTFDIDQTRPDAGAVVKAAGDWLAALEAGESRRLDNAVLIRHALFMALDICVERDFPLQLHTAVGDLDIDMPKCDPTVFVPFIKQAEAMKVPLTLLHCYPFVQQATWLAEVFQNVYFDVGFTLNFTGPQAIRTMEQAMEMGPFFKQLYSSDAFGLAELHYLGRIQFERMMDKVMGQWLADGDITLKEADRIIDMITHGNAARIYRLTE